VRRPIWLFSMDSEQFYAPPTTNAALQAYYAKYGTQATDANIRLVHFRDEQDIALWLKRDSAALLEESSIAREQGLQPLLGFSFYTWNAAEFLTLIKTLKDACPDLLIVVGGPHVQQAEDYLFDDSIDIVVLGEGEVTFQKLLDASASHEWFNIDGLAFLSKGEMVKTAARNRTRDMSRFPSALDVLPLVDDAGTPLYESISYETCRGCPFKCAFCEWGTGDLGSKMYGHSMERIRADWEKIVAAGIKNIWLADSNFGALKTDIDKAKLIVELKQKTGLPQSFATSWSKKHNPRVQEIVLLLHEHQLLPHYQLALQTLTPEALELSHRKNMGSNAYQPIAKSMSEQGVPIAAELIWGLPGDNLPSFEANLDLLLAIFPNINIFGYTLLPGTEFYEKRELYKIEALPVAGYGKAKGEYVVGCHSFNREQGEEGYFLITAHILLLHGHILPLTTRYLALEGSIPVSPLLRAVLDALLIEFEHDLSGADYKQRMAIYENRNELYLTVLEQRSRCYASIVQCVRNWLSEHHAPPALKKQIDHLLSLDELFCPRMGDPVSVRAELDFDVTAVTATLDAMELPETKDFFGQPQAVQVSHPGGLGSVVLVADGGSWIKGAIQSIEHPTRLQVQHPPEFQLATEIH
jgi:tRNA A37 methylthiotransferase MiaB